jgi:hypothetical protein
MKLAFLIVTVAKNQNGPLICKISQTECNKNLIMLLRNTTFHLRPHANEAL